MIKIKQYWANCAMRRCLCSAIHANPELQNFGKLLRYIENSDVISTTIRYHTIHLFLGYRGRRGLHLSSQCDVMLCDDTSI